MPGITNPSPKLLVQGPAPLSRPHIANPSPNLIIQAPDQLPNPPTSFPRWQMRGLRRWGHIPLRRRGALLGGPLDRGHFRKKYKFKSAQNQLNKEMLGDHRRRLRRIKISLKSKLCLWLPGQSINFNPSCTRLHPQACIHRGCILQGSIHQCCIHKACMTPR